MKLIMYLVTVHRTQLPLAVPVVVTVLLQHLSSGCLLILHTKWRPKTEGVSVSSKFIFDKSVLSFFFFFLSLRV